MNSQKDNLLAIASSIPNPPLLALYLAKKIDSDESVKRLQKKLNDDVKKNNFAYFMLHIFMYSVFTVFCIYSHFSVEQVSADKVKTASLSVLIFIISCGFVFVAMRMLGKPPFGLPFPPKVSRIDEIVWCNEISKGLAYVTKGTVCDDGARAMRLDPVSTTLWRDLALAERTQLSVYDIEIMKALATNASAAKLKELNEKSREENCRLLHGLT